MKFLKWFLVLLLPVAVVVALVAPIGPLPGFRIGGEPAPVPAVWPDTSNLHEIKLKVPGAVPRVVIIWVVEHNQELHVVGSADSGWVKRLGQGKPVEVRLQDNTYALNAVRQTANLAPVLRAYIDKYKTDYPDIVAGFPSLEDGFDQFAVFTLNRGP